MDRAAVSVQSGDSPEERNRYGPGTVETNGRAATGFEEAKTSHIKRDRLIYVEH